MGRFSSLFVAILVLGLSSPCPVYAKSLSSLLTTFQPNARTGISQLTDRQVIGQCDETTVYAGKQNSQSATASLNTVQKSFWPTCEFILRNENENSCDWSSNF